MKILFILLLTLLTLSSPAQTYHSVVQHNNFIVADRDGLAVADDGRYAILADNGSELIINSWNKNNSLEWSMTITSTDGITVGAITFDEDGGNLYIAGVFTDNITFTGGTTIITNSWDLSYFVAKITPSGVVRYTDHFTTTATSGLEIYDAAFSDGKFIFGGFFRNTTLHGVHAMSDDAMIVCRDSTLSFEWIKTVASSGASRVTGIDAKNGRISATGFFEDNPTNFGNGQFESKPGGEGPHYDFFIAHYDLTTGNTLWVASAGTPNSDQEFYTALDDNLNTLCVGAQVQDGLVIKNEDGGTANIIQRHGAVPNFVVKYSSTGNVQWSKPILAGLLRSSWIISYDIATNTDGNVLIGGSLDGDLAMTWGTDTTYLSADSQDPFMLKLDGTTGETTWGQVFNTSSGGDLARDIEANGNKIYFSPRFENTVDLDPGPDTEMLDLNDGWAAIVIYDDHNEWRGASSDWTDSTNWRAGHPPSQYEDVYIPETMIGGTSFPTITAAKSCGRVTMEQNTSLIGQHLLDADSVFYDTQIAGYTSDLDGWNLVGIPLSGSIVDSAGFYPGDWDDLYTWDEIRQIWRNVKDESNPASWWDEFDLGRGYLVARETTETLTNSGDFSSQSVFDISLSHTADVEYPGWNLVANPFPSNVDWSGADLVDSNSPKTLNPATGAYEDLSGDWEFGEGIMVYANSTGASLTVNVSDQVHTGGSKKTTNEMNQAKLVANFGGHSVYTTLVADTDATNGWDALDARYLSPLTQIPIMCHYTSDEVYVSKFAWNPGDLAEIPMWFTVPASSKDIDRIHGRPSNDPAMVKNPRATHEMEITFSLEGNLKEKVVLVDKHGTETELSAGLQYTCTVSSDDEPNRFFLKLEATGIDEFSEEIKTIDAFPNPCRDQITLHTPTNTHIEIITASGQLIERRDVDGTLILNVRDWAPGIYFLKSKKEIKKIIKQ